MQLIGESAPQFFVMFSNYLCSWLVGWLQQRINSVLKSDTNLCCCGKNMSTRDEPNKSKVYELVKCIKLLYLFRAVIIAATTESLLLYLPLFNFLARVNLCAQRNGMFE